MTKQILLERYPEQKYALVKREGAVQPYVVAYNPKYNESGEIESWGSGTYFTLLLDAAHYLYAKIHEKDSENDIMFRNIIMDWLSPGFDFVTWTIVQGTRLIVADPGDGDAWFQYEGSSWEELFEKNCKNDILEELAENPEDEKRFFTKEEIDFLKERYAKEFEEN